MSAPRTLGLAAAGALIWALAAWTSCCDSGDAGSAPAGAGSIAIEDPFAPAAPGDTAALYFRARDESGAGDTLLGAESPRAAGAMLHETVVENGTARMRPAEEGLEVPPGGVLELRPGGAHVMLMGVHPPLVAGETLAVELEFARAGKVALRAPVVPLGQALERAH